MRLVCKSLIGKGFSPLAFSLVLRYNDCMNCENSLKIGDVVKSLDFVGINDCYYVGLVVSISKMDSTFRAKTIKRVWQGEIDKKFPSDFFVAPLQGQLLSDDRGTRVEVIA